MSKKTGTPPLSLSGRIPCAVVMSVGILITLLWSSSPHAQPAPGTVLITGSSQGHGLAFVQDYAERGWRVIATCRTPEKAQRLQAIAREFNNVTIEELDLTDFPEVDALAEKYQGTAIDVLNLNGAINTFRLGPTQFGNMDYDRFAQVLQVNMIGQLYVAEAFLEHVAASKQKKIAVMSAVGGSIGRVSSTTAPAYRASKAGLNMLMRTYGEAVKRRGVIVAIIAPGTVDIGDYLNAKPGTVMTERYRRLIAAGALAPRSAIGAMIDLIDGLTINDIDTFHRWDGQTLPW